MVEARHRTRRSDPVALVEAALVILLLALFIFLYVLPSQRRLSEVSWWSPVVLGIVALAVLLLDLWRRRRRYRLEMREMKEQQLGGEG